MTPLRNTKTKTFQLLGRSTDCPAPNTHHWTAQKTGICCFSLNHSHNFSGRQPTNGLQSLHITPSLL